MMTQSSLDLRITVKADEATLNDIQKKLLDPNDDCSNLSQAIATMVHQMLIAAGVTNDVDINFQCGHIKNRIDTGGGLNAQEWMKES